MLEQVVALMKTVNKNKEVSIELKHDPKLDSISLLGDEMMIKQVLVNLISNAIKYTPNGYIRTVASIVSANAQFCTVLFCVEGIQLLTYVTYSI